MTRPAARINRVDTTSAPPEVWLRGPIAGVPPILMPAAQTLVQAGEDAHRAAIDLEHDELWSRPGGVASPGFHLRHMAGVIDRMLTYARGDVLSEAQFAALRAEGDQHVLPNDVSSLLEGLQQAINAAMGVYRATAAIDLFEVRRVGRAALPSSVFGLLFHAAEHAQRHAGQLITTAMLVRSMSATV